MSRVIFVFMFCGRSERLRRTVSKMETAALNDGWMDGWLGFLGEIDGMTDRRRKR